MAEYIEREALFEDFRLCGADKGLVEAIIYRIKQHPIADVVEVVRCKDCKHLNKEKMICTNVRIRVFNTGHPTFSNHFCSYGERKPKETVSLVDGHIDKSNKCVSCGTDIPEGTWTCPICDKRWE